MLNKKESNMNNWERQEIIKTLKQELASAKRSHKRYENKIAKKHQDELGYITQRLNGVNETLLRSDCKVADEAGRILKQLLTLIPDTLRELQQDKELNVAGTNWDFQYDLVNQIKELEEPATEGVA